MADPESHELNLDVVTPEARRFAKELFARFPNFRSFASMERSRATEPWTLVVVVPAPSGDSRAELVVWVDNGDEPSVAFGHWHTHEDVWMAGNGASRSPGGMLGLVEGILAERYVVCEDVGGEGHGSATLVDLHDEDALLDEITSKYSPGEVQLRSWTGKHDRVVDLESLVRRNPA